MRRQPFLVLGLWGLLVSWVSQKISLFETRPKCPVQRPFYPDFSHVVCDRLSVDIMNDRFTLISKLIGIVV